MHHLCVDTGYSLEDLPREMTYRDGYERIKGICAISTTYYYFDDDDDYYYFNDKD